MGNLAEARAQSDPEAKVKEGLEQCNLCTVALVSAIKERVDEGESVNAVCKEYEKLQKELHGEILYPLKTLASRYYRTTKGKRKVDANASTPAEPQAEKVGSGEPKKQKSPEQFYRGEAKKLKGMTNRIANFIDKARDFDLPEAEAEWLACEMRDLFDTLADLNPKFEKTFMALISEGQEEI